MKSKTLILAAASAAALYYGYRWYSNRERTDTAAAAADSLAPAAVSDLISNVGASTAYQASWVPVSGGTVSTLPSYSALRVQS